MLETTRSKTLFILQVDLLAKYLLLFFLITQGKKAEDSKEKNETVSHRPVPNISSTATETPSQPEPVQFLRSPGTRKRWCAGQGARPTLVVCPLSVLSNWEVSNPIILEWLVTVLGSGRFKNN